MANPLPRALANEWLKDLCLGLRNLSHYGVEHPRGREYLQRAHESLLRLLDGRPHVRLTRDDGRLHLGPILLDQEFGLADRLADDLARHRINNIVFRESVTASDLLAMMACLLQEPRRDQRGDFARRLRKEGARGIRVNRVHRDHMTDPAQADLVGFVEELARGRCEIASVTRVLMRAGAALAKAIEEAAERREPEPIEGDVGLAEFTAEILDRVADRAIEEHERSREEVFELIGRCAVATRASIHEILFLDKAGPRSVRRNIIAAVESLPPDAIGTLVKAHHPSPGGDYRRLAAMLSRTRTWRVDREACISAIEESMAAAGVPSDAIRDLGDRLQWGDLPVQRRLELLSESDMLWQSDFPRLRDALTKLVAGERIGEARTLLVKYLEGLGAADPVQRRRVADNARHALALLEKTPRLRAATGRIAEILFARLASESDPEIASRLASGLAFLVDLMLREREAGRALALMVRADALKDPRLTESLERVGNDKTFERLTDLFLTGEDRAPVDAAELLRRCGSRAATYLIERLAQEESRPQRARLVGLLKEMGGGSPEPFLARLDDPRWFLVRNVVAILGDIGDQAIAGRLGRVAAHPEPRVRQEVISTWRRLGTPEAADRIIKALEDSDAGVQRSAVEALALLGGVRAVQTLERIASREAPYADAPAEVRLEAVLSLGRIGGAKAFEILHGILTRRSLLGPSEVVEVRTAAARALGALGTPKALSLLTEMSRKDPRRIVRDTAQEILKQRSQVISGRR